VNLKFIVNTAEMFVADSSTNEIFNDDAMNEIEENRTRKSKYFTFI